MPIERPKTIASQVFTILLDRIRSQEYAPGSRLPSESELTQELDVSRATVRSALGRLAAKGLIIRKPGDGTYVNAHIEQIPTRMGGMWDFLRLIENSGFQATIRLLNQQVRPATAAEATALNTSPGTPVLSLTRQFCADDRPVIMAHTAVPAALLDQNGAPFAGELPIADFVRRYCHKEIAYAIFDIKATIPDAAIQVQLQRDLNAPLLQLSQVFYDGANRPIIFSLSEFDEQAVSLRLVQTWE